MPGINDIAAVDAELFVPNESLFELVLDLLGMKLASHGDE
jgi:hypothetical protein